MSGWRCTQLTSGSEAGRFHAHSYYDLPVFDTAGRRLVLHRMTMQGRDIRPEDAIDIGVVDIDGDRTFTPLATSTAWSWQQGPMAQWIAGSQRIVFNTRTKGRFHARIVDTHSGEQRDLPRTVYAAAPEGHVFYGLDMRRLEHLRPGYGYATGEAMPDFEPAPRDNGVWCLDESGPPVLLISIARIRAVYLRRASLIERAWHRAGRVVYWLNHLKLSPDGNRFTVKLRWRRIGGNWSDAQSVSLTIRSDGRDVRVLGRGLSHVIWLNSGTLYGWRTGQAIILADRDAGVASAQVFAPGLIRQNVHLRHLPPGSSDVLSEAVFDTPYAETVDLLHYRTGDQAGAAAVARIARFAGHVPARGALRCDLHPCPSPDGRRIVVTSLADGGRQVYLLERGANRI
ncbi:MAG: hypothetical protein V2J51_15880 [Erythrobacter sp.]|nr:hypothetical protein [Erythrobacter sp.]